MNEHRTSAPVTFGDLPVGKYFVSKRDPQWGPLMKCNSHQAVDDSDVHWRIAADEEVLT